MAELDTRLARLAQVTDLELLVQMIHVETTTAGGRNDFVIAVELRIREIEEQKERRLDPADPTSSDAGKLRHWLARERTSLAPDQSLVDRLVASIEAQEERARQADPVDLTTEDLGALLRWREREAATLRPNADLVRAIEERFVALHSSAATTKPPADALHDRVRELEARIAAVEAAR